jgi:hypothetical protein
VVHRWGLVKKTQDEAQSQDSWVLDLTVTSIVLQPGKPWVEVHLTMGFMHFETLLSSAEVSTSTFGRESAQAEEACRRCSGGQGGIVWKEEDS